MADIEPQLLKYLQNTSSAVESTVIAEVLGVDHQGVVGALKSLGTDNFVALEQVSRQVTRLTEEGTDVARNGSPEYRLWAQLASGKQLEQAEVNAVFKDQAQIAIQNGMKQKALQTKKEGKLVFYLRSASAAESFSDGTRDVLAKIEAGKTVDEKDLDGVKRRKLVAVETLKSLKVSKGPAFSLERKKAVADITKEMIADGSWTTQTFKKFNFEAKGEPPESGCLHPLLRVRQEFREIFLELGFQEMETSQFVDSSFWNFDTLFVPQQHPARDMQDTFFVSDPATSSPPPADYLQRVKAVHEQGYVNDWSEKETRRNVLRTHTTAVSSFALYNLAQSSPIGPDGKRQFKPGKYFSIDRVFRNEEMDRTHLCEFHQIEGFIIDRNLSLAHMMHTLNQFFRRVGIEKLRFKPAFNPYTEPSMEIFGYHSGLKKWMEVGNSGMFRPEMLQPMGFDEDVTAIAWGLSLERPTMIKYALSNIHDLFGHKVSLNFIKKAPICRY
jgi:phenylalanyl-tRNA synthetase alpha chain